MNQLISYYQKSLNMKDLFDEYRNYGDCSERFSQEEQISYIDQLLKGLDYLHSLDIIHKELNTR